MPKYSKWKNDTTQKPKIRVIKSIPGPCLTREALIGFIQQMLAEGVKPDNKTAIMNFVRQKVTEKMFDHIKLVEDAYNLLPKGDIKAAEYLFDNHFDDYEKGK